MNPQIPSALYSASETTKLNWTCTKHTKKVREILSDGQFILLLSLSRRLIYKNLFLWLPLD